MTQLSTSRSTSNTPTDHINDHNEIHRLHDLLDGVLPLAVAATVTAAGPLAVNKHNPIDATAGLLTMILPTGQLQGSIIIAEKYDSSANAVTISGSIRGVPASTYTLVLAHQTTMFEADAAGSWWPVSSHKALATLDGRYVPQTQTQAAGPTGLSLLSATAANADAGQWSLNLAGASFFGASDSVMVLGYNALPASGGKPTIPSAPALYLQWESDYYQNGTAHKMEFHLDFASKTNAATTIAVGSNGLTLPQGTLNVISTAGFPSFGNLTVATTGGPDTVNYTGITGTTFTGCSGGTHAMVTGQAVTVGFNINRPVMIQIDRDTGLMNQFSLQATSLSFLDWVTQLQFGALSMGGFNLFGVVGATDPTITIGSNPAGGTPVASTHSHIRLYDAGFAGGAASFQIDTQSGAQTVIAAQGTSLLYFFYARGCSINVLDNTAAFTVTGNALGLVSQFRMGVNAGDLTRWQETGGTTHIKVTQATSAIPASLVVGKAVLANAATDGFLYIPTVAGAPSGVPTAQTGTVPILFDTTNNYLYAYLGGAWKKTTVFA